MSFVPYTYYDDASIVLKPAHQVQIGGHFYTVVYPRGPFRRTVTINANAGVRQVVTLGLSDAGVPSATGTPYSLGGFAGDITSRQIAQHLRFLAFANITPEVSLAWMDLTSLVSEIKDERFDSIKAGLGNPFPINLWSFDQSMALILTIDNTGGGGPVQQKVYLDMVEYKMAPSKKTPKRFILLTEKGFATAPVIRALMPEIQQMPPTGTTQAKPSVVVKDSYARRRR